MSDADWYFEHDNERKGPFSDEQMIGLHRLGTLNPHTKVWSAESGEWRPLYKTSLRETLQIKEVAPPAAKPTEAPPQIAPVFPASGRVAANGRETDITFITGVTKFLNGAVGFASAVVIFSTLKAGSGGRYVHLANLEMSWLGIASAILGLTAVVVFLVWSYQATKKVFETCGEQSVSPAGSVYWYFVPIFWFWKPLEAMLNIVKCLRGDPTMSAEDYTKTVYGWWFVTLGSVAFVILAAIAVPDTTVLVQQSAADAYVAFSVISYSLTTIGCVLFNEILKRVKTS